MKRVAVTLGMLATSLACGTAWASITSRPRADFLPALAERIEPVQSQVFQGRSAGWYWVYGGVAHAQSFVATGADLRVLRLRVARLNEKEPNASLEVEVRDSRLGEVLAQGVIRPESAGRSFRWAEAELACHAALEPGRRYVLLIQSQGTRHDAPWLVNAIFRDLYPDGRHLGYADDLLFALRYADGPGLVVGPPADTDFVLPFNSGRPGGVPVPTRPTLSFGGFSCPAVAASDPLGPVPPARKAGLADSGRSPRAR